ALEGKRPSSAPTAATIQPINPLPTATDLWLGERQGRNKGAKALFSWPYFVEGGQNIVLLRMALRLRPGLDRQVEAAPVLRLGHHPLLDQDAGEAVGQGEGRLAQDAGADGGDVPGRGSNGSGLGGSGWHDARPPAATAQPRPIA